MQNHLITEAERDAVYKTIYSRRDIRSYFTSEPIPSEVLARILQAAHHAGSVGYMQPWNFIIVEDKTIREKVKEVFEREKQDAARLFEDGRRERYLSFKLEGILEAPVNLVVTSDPTRFGPQVIGRHSMPETHLYSTCCAIQNLWLAARAENIGVGWVSILKREDLRSIFNVPRHIAIVAYLCLGYVTCFPDQPDLERVGWGKRLPLEDLVYFDFWNGKPAEKRKDLVMSLRNSERRGAPLSARKSGEIRPDGFRQHSGEWAPEVVRPIGRGQAQGPAPTNENWAPHNDVRKDFP